MESIRLIYEQIEQAKKYLMNGSLLQLRLALILLDNAAELLMHRELQLRFSWDDEMMPKWEPARTEWISAGLGAKYTDEERRDSEKEFEPKLRILHLRLKKISDDDRKVLCVSHKLRCEAFHRGHIRPQILAQVSRVLFTTVVELTVKLPLQEYRIPGGDLDSDNAAFLERFGFRDAYALGTDEGRLKLKRKLGEGVGIDPLELAHALSSDLIQRVDETIEGLAYVGGAEDRTKIDHNLQYTQFWREIGSHMLKNGIYEPQLREEFKARQLAGRAKFTLSKIERWRRMAHAIAHYVNPAVALDHYWAIDKRFAPLEQDVAQTVSRYDDDVNMQIHHRR